MFIFVINYVNHSHNLYIYIYMLYPPTGCSRADTLLNVHFVLFFYSVFCFSTMLPWGAGGAGTTVSSSDVFCLCPFALVFTVFFALSHSCFFAPSAFSLGFYSVFRLHDVADATLHIGVGWGGAITFMWTWSRCWGFIMLLMLQGGMLTFHVTCSRCWCYATLGWGGC